MTEEKKTTTVRGIATQWDFDVLGSYEVVKVLFELRGERAGQTREWTGFFSDSSLERTLQSLRHCGWIGETLGDMSGMGTQEVNLVLEEKRENGKTYEKVLWVNKLPSLRLKAPMTKAALIAFSEKMARITADSARSYGIQPGTSKPQTQQTSQPSFDGAPPDHAYDGPDEFGDIPF